MYFTASPNGGWRKHLSLFLSLTFSKDTVTCDLSFPGCFMTLELTWMSHSLQLHDLLKLLADNRENSHQGLRGMLAWTYLMGPPLMPPHCLTFCVQKSKVSLTSSGLDSFRWSWLPFLVHGPWKPSLTDNGTETLSKACSVSEHTGDQEMYTEHCFWWSLSRELQPEPASSSWWHVSLWLTRQLLTRVCCLITFPVICSCRLSLLAAST